MQFAQAQRQHEEFCRAWYGLCGYPSEMFDHLRPVDPMIRIFPSKNADTRTCDYTNVTKAELRANSEQHIGDVRVALGFFAQMLYRAAAVHDVDKVTDIDGFHANFVGGFKAHDWLDRHRSLNRHHLNEPGGCPDDVNLIDVLDLIADMVMSSKGRGSDFPIELPPELLYRAFTNTVHLLKSVVVVDASSVTEPDNAT